MIKKIFASAGLFVASMALLVGLATGVVGASPYGSGSYGSCKYGEGCSTSSSSGGSSGSSETPSSDNGSSILLNDYTEYFQDSGKSVTLGEGGSVSFDVTVNGQTTRYTATVTNVGSNFVDIVIMPGNLTVRLEIGQTKQLDVNGDGINDLEVTLTSIKGGKAVLAWVQLRAAAGGSTTPTAGESGHSSLWLYIVLTGLGLLLFLILFLWRRRKDKDQTSRF